MKQLILIALGLTLLASCSLTTPTQDTQNNLTPTGARIVSSTNYQQDIDAASSKIKNTTEFKDCMKQQTNMCIQSTGMQIAQKSKDTNFCKELSTPEEQSSCEFAITMLHAQENDDEKLCDVLKNINYLNQCKIQVYRQAAIKKKDITLCNKIGELPASEKSEISSESDTQKDQCIIQYITSSPNSKESDCKKLSNAATLDMCTMMLKNKPQLPIDTISTSESSPLPIR